MLVQAKKTAYLFLRERVHIISKMQFGKGLDKGGSENADCMFSSNFRSYYVQNGQYVEYCELSQITSEGP